MIENRCGDLICVFGKLGKDNRIYLTNRYEPWFKKQNAYGLEMSKEFYVSLIVREVAHFITEKIIGRKIESSRSEYIAYVVQFSQMQPKVRQAILNQSFLPAFKTYQTSLDIMLLDPAVFAVKSYLHFKKDKGQFLK